MQFSCINCGCNNTARYQITGCEYCQTCYLVLIEPRVYAAWCIQNIDSAKEGD